MIRKPLFSKGEKLARSLLWYFTTQPRTSPMIRDTSAQDQTLSSHAAPAPWKRWLWPAVAALVVLLAIGFAARAWLGASR